MTDRELKAAEIGLKARWSMAIAQQKKLRQDPANTKARDYATYLAVGYLHAVAEILETTKGPTIGEAIVMDWKDEIEDSEGERLIY